MINFLRSLFGLPKVYRVMKVCDGDTIKLDNRWDVRIAGIDAPELKQPGGPEARDYLKRLIDEGDGKVWLDVIGVDKYGRKLANVHNGGGNLGEVLLYHGFVHRYMDKGLYLKQEEWSKRKKKGVHSKRSEKPSDYRRRLKVGQ